MDFKKGDKVMLLDIEPNRFICKKYEVDLLNKVGIVDEVEFYENKSELVAIFDGLMINMRIFPIWIKL